MKKQKVVYALALVSAAFVFACKGNSNNNNPTVTAQSSPTPAPSASAAPSASPVQAAFRFLGVFIGCGPVTPGTCSVKDWVVDQNANYVERTSGHTGQISTADWQNIVSKVNAFWAQYATATPQCQDPSGPIVGGHDESLTVIVANATEMIFTHEAAGRECGRGSLQQARDLNDFVKTTMNKYQ